MLRAISNNNMGMISFLNSLLAEENPLHKAVHSRDKKALERVLSETGNINATDRLGRTALHVASNERQINAVRVLLDRRINIHAKDFLGMSAMNLADAYQAFDVAELLLQYGASYRDLRQTTITMKKNLLTLAIPIRQGFEKVCHYILKKTRRDELLPIWGTLVAEAVLHKQTSSLRILLEFRPSKDTKYNPLVLTYVLTKSPLLHMAVQGPPKLVDVLLELSENAELFINRKDHVGNTPLHLAARAGDPLTVLVLLKHGADIKAQNREKEIPLHFAAASGRSRVACLLVRRGSPIHVFNKSRRSPIHMARKAGNVLLAQGLEKEVAARRN